MIDPVLIVGSGPTGLTAALELAGFGIAVRLIDKRDAPASTSRAIGVQSRTLELMEQRGLSEEMVRLGNKAHYASVYGGGKRVFRLDFSQVESFYNYILFLSQAETERILHERLASLGVKSEWRVEMIAFEQDIAANESSKATAILKHCDGKLETVKTPWIISAEGAHSKVRTTLDLQFEGNTRTDQYALGDLHIDGDLPDSELHIFSSEHGFLAMFPLGGTRFRMIASDPIGDPTRGAPPTEDELQQVFSQRSPLPGRIHDTTWTSWFRINSRMVERVRVGQLLLGGDAAHIHSPAGGQGMNTGIQDMINLSWKLALVMQGKAPEALLDTYGQERLTVMRDVLFKTEHLTDMIGDENHVVRTLFNHFAPWVAGNAVVQHEATNNMAQIQVAYESSPLAVNSHNSASLKAGQRVPELLVRDRATGESAKRLLTLLNPRNFTLLVAHGDSDDVFDPALVSALDPWKSFISVVELAPPAGGGEDAYKKVLGHSSQVFLVRPDGYVAIAAGKNFAPGALSEWCKKWLTATAVPVSVA